LEEGNILLWKQTSVHSTFPLVEGFVATTDVTKKSEVDASFARFLGSGKVGVVVNNAGTMGPVDWVEDPEE
jgi:NAD(P)-dependent dehydrogenase (short-subunit alcohol dehydrogenase family)